jgi:membrane associated rhomboid family serine protease
VIEQASYAVLSLVIVLLAFVAYWTRPYVAHELLRLSSRRLIYGLPLGTFVIVGVNVAFFLLAQRAYGGGNVLTIPFISWSYGYPLGFLTAPIGHASLSHILGNLLTTLVFAPVAEYVIGHKSSRRPLVRALVVIPLAWYAVGVFISVFSLGPSIGFSGVLFFFFGFVVVFYPVVSVGLIVVSSVFRTVVGALRSPVSVESTVETVTTPSWANIAVDAHALGFLLGVGLAVIFARRTERNVDGYRVGAAVLLVGLAQGLHLVWLADGSSYVLYRGFGVALVAVLALFAAYGSAVESSAPPVLGMDELPARRALSVAALAVPVVLLCGTGFVTGFGAVSTVDDVDTVEVGDYSVWYGEGVENQRVFSIPLIEFTPANFTSSGVIVTSDQRGVWRREVTARGLRSNPNRTFLVGGLSWDEEVRVERVGMTSPTGDDSYSVFVTSGNESRPVFDSSPAETGVKIDGWSLDLSVTDGDRSVTMERDGTRRVVYLGSQPTEVEGVTFEVEERRIVASSGDTEAVLGRIDGARKNSIR